MRKSSLAIGLLVAATLASGSAGAQTTMNGPYYANPSWDQQFPAAQRFIVLSNWTDVFSPSGAAVLDRETGLVWQRFPNAGGDWASMEQFCMGRNIGGRFGWRLPSVPELMSLMDSTQSTPALPAGHPFQNVQGFYWGANPYVVDTSKSWSVDSANAELHFDKFFAGAWCMRGPVSDADPR